jgi:hypothetical protein
MTTKQSLTHHTAGCFDCGASCDARNVDLNQGIGGGADQQALLA